MVVPIFEGRKHVYVNSIQGEIGWEIYAWQPSKGYFQWVLSILSLFCFMDATQKSFWILWQATPLAFQISTEIVLI